MGYCDDVRWRVRQVLRRAAVAGLVVATAVGIRLPVVGAEESAPNAWRDSIEGAGRRYGHVAVRLDDGRVLVAGGMDDTRQGLLRGAIVFDPATRSVTRIEDMSAPRYQPAAARLGDGTVMIIGGMGGPTSTDRYVPALRRWIPAAAMSTARWGHTATVLGDGRVLVVGGQGEGRSQTLASAEIYNPLSNRWTPAANMAMARHSHQAIPLADGAVLVVGGKGPGSAEPHLASAEIYRPSTDTWTRVPDMNVPRVEHTATLLQNGRVLVVGGASDDGDGWSGDEYWATSEIFDPATRQWSPSGHMAVARAGHTATALGDGRVFVAGGSARWNEVLTSAEIYDPATGQWHSRDAMSTPRYLHTATPLSNGTQILVVGGWNANGGAIGDVGLYQG
jgi:N-acetylneuraminic acid mutarotase